MQVDGVKKSIFARKIRGFTLVEIVIVVGIIVLLAAVAIPNMMRARLDANEAGAIKAMETIAAAAISFRVANAQYPSNLSELVGVSPPYIDDALGAGYREGYDFNLSLIPGGFSVVATPHTPNVTGVRSFYVDTSGVIRASDTGTADETSVPVGG